MLAKTEIEAVVARIGCPRSHGDSLRDYYATMQPVVPTSFIAGSNSTHPTRLWAGGMWILTWLFLLRVLGQAVQRWIPQFWLPPFEAWQGSSMQYSLLLSSQIAILCFMGAASHRAWSGRTQARSRSARWLATVGLMYMGLSLGRLAVGISIESAPAWFRAWISGAFHVVLAAFLLAYAGYHYVQRPGSAESE